MSDTPAPELGLECIIGGQRFGLAANHVKQIVEYDVVSPLPLGRSWVGGLGLLGTRVLVSIAFTAQEGKLTRRSTKGVLLQVEDSSIDWALEVNAVGSFVRADMASPRGKKSGPARLGGRELPGWVTRVETSDGQPIGWIDAVALVKFLSSVGSTTDGLG